MILWGGGGYGFGGTKVPYGDVAFDHEWMPQALASESCAPLSQRQSHAARLFNVIFGNLIGTCRDLLTTFGAPSGYWAVSMLSTL